jgi:guanylate kinase
MATTPGMLLVISGPSGVGKTTITHAIERQVQGAVFSVSVTTRPKTEAEVEGRDYFFVTDEAFDSMIQEGEFLEYAGVFGKRYGTPRTWVDRQLSQGKLVILEIDVQGAQSVRRQRPGALCVFILPPNEESLLERLHARGRESEAVIQRRFGEARREMEIARNGGVYDIFVVNSNLQDAVARVVALVKAERERRGLAAATS